MMVWIFFTAVYLAGAAWSYRMGHTAGQLKILRGRVEETGKEIKLLIADPDYAMAKIEVDNYVRELQS